MTLEKIHELTSMGVGDASDMKTYPESWVKIYFKSYPRFRKIDLPEPNKISSSLYDLLLKRSSKRDFVDKAITLSDLSDLLFYSSGIINKDSIESLDDSRRAYPSAGGRFPIEIYLSIHNCEGVDAGVYHYNVISHKLELLILGDQTKELLYFIDQKMILNASVLFMISSPYKRTQVKYGLRAYRYIHLDAGHLAQNMYLVAENLGIGCCTIGGFTDDKINEFFDFPEDEKMIYLGVLGKYD